MVLQEMSKADEQSAAVSKGNVAYLVEEMWVAREMKNELRRVELAQENGACSEIQAKINIFAKDFTCAL